MALIVRETVGTGDGVGVLADVVATVVVVTVCVVYVDGDVVCVCADTSAAAAKKKTARDKFFTLVLDLGEIERFLILYMVRDEGLKAKDRKGWVFGNCWLPGMPMITLQLRLCCRAILGRTDECARPT
jgi:hypothetical protein